MLGRCFVSIVAKLIVQSKQYLNGDLFRAALILYNNLVNLMKELIRIYIYII